MPGKNDFLLLSWFILLALTAGNAAESPQSFLPAAALKDALKLLGLETREVTPVPVHVTPAEGVSLGKTLACSNLDSVVKFFASLPETLASLQNTGDYLVYSRKLLELEELPLPEAEMPPGLLVAADSLDALVPGAGESLAELVLADHLLRSAYRFLTPAELEELKKLVKGFSFHRDQWPHYPVARMLELARKVDLARLWAASLAAQKAALSLRRALEKKKLDPDALIYHSDAETLFQLDTPWGAVIVGGSGANEYREPALLIVEPGGDDSYRFQLSSWPKVSMIIDLEGNDRYTAQGPFTMGGALAGLWWIEDCAGADSYEGENFSLGAAALGVGVLIDRSGADSYQGSSFSQGASFFGLGMLVDLEGDDCYEVSFGGQGACMGGGMALLVDLAGDDSYSAGGKYPDWREPGATKSFSQGAAGGLRPFSAGGVALLYDRSGRDTYRIDYFGQGAGYWGGCGMLIDRRGDDSYRSMRYSQGCGLHMSVGLLADVAGDDTYTTGAVSQGAGEDRAYGILLEGSGSDEYRVQWMARGAGGAAGVGLLLELEGDDRYHPARKAADGWGSRWQELSGLGFLIDCAGDDLYADAEKGGFISRSGTWGARVDLPLGNGR